VFLGKPVVLFKVLRGMQSCNGGSHSWVLGKKYAVRGKLSMCSAGFHLTTNPQSWLEQGCRVYFAEAFGIEAWKDDKCVCRSVRLLKNQDPEGISKETLAKWNAERDAVDAKWKPERDAVDAKWKPERDAVYAKWNAERDAVYAKWNAERDAVDAKWNAERDAVDAKWKPERDAVDAKWRNVLFEKIAELYRLQNKTRKQSKAKAMGGC
jgi:hypothetical protein